MEQTDCIKNHISEAQLCICVSFKGQTISIHQQYLSVEFSKYKGKKAIIWDWNGTLLDDIDICIYCMNIMLRKRGISEIQKKKYREIFTFPVKDYYEKAGFDFNAEEFKIPAIEFIDHYYENLTKADLFPSVTGVLERFKSMGKYQAILSAMEHDSLIRSMKEKGVIDYFDLISGIDDHYAHSKLEMGRELISQMNFIPEEILLVGDTLHDFEVGSMLNLDVVLVANGHQSKRRLLESTPNVLNDLPELIKMID